MTKPFTKTQLIIAAIGLIIFSVIPLSIYIYFFSSHDRSLDPADWGTFGDFIGGTTNVILGIINIGITAYIAYLIKTLDDKRYEEQKQLDELRHQQNLNFQHNLYVRELQQKEFEKFNHLLEELYLLISSEPYFTKLLIKLVAISFRMKKFLETNKYLFPFIDDDLINEHTSNLGDVKDLYKKYASTNGISTFDVVNHEKVKKLITINDSIFERFIWYLKINEKTSD